MHCATHALTGLRSNFNCSISPFIGPLRRADRGENGVVLSHPAAKGWLTKPATNAYLGYMLRSFDFCLPTRSTTVPDGEDWLHEVKYDGYRLQVERAGGRGAADHARRLRLNSA
jgi:hypothetical protein